MNKKLFLTSAIALGFTCPAIAEPTNTGNFPNDGLMQADYTYTNAATSTNMDGVYEGTVNAEAQYTDVLYNIAAGNYLEGGSELENGTQCPAGSWCPGLTNATYDAVNDQGINTCPNGYTGSAAGATANTDCFRTCALSDITHATAITGNVYYNGTNGDGVKACTPTSCDNGYHPKSATPDLTTLIGVSEAGIDCVSNDNAGQQADAILYVMTSSSAGISGDSKAFAVDYGNKGMIKGHGRCSKQEGDDDNNTWTTFATLLDETGQNGAEYCYCHLDSYTPVNGSAIALSGSWVFVNDFSRIGATCANTCSWFCGSYLAYDDSYSLAFRATMFNSLGTPGPASCEANTITINWNGTTDTEINANEAGTATYGSDIRTPRSASHVPGKTFTGWRFSAPTPVQSGN